MNGLIPPKPVGCDCSGWVPGGDTDIDGPPIADVDEVEVG